MLTIYHKRDDLIQQNFDQRDILFHSIRSSFDGLPQEMKSWQYFLIFSISRGLFSFEDVENVTADQEIDGSSLKKKTDK